MAAEGDKRELDLNLTSLTLIATYRSVIEILKMEAGDTFGRSITNALIFCLSKMSNMQKEERER